MSDAKRIESLLLVDPLARDKGHLLDDDLFLAECLSPITDRFEVRSSPESIARIRERLRVKCAPLEPAKSSGSLRLDYIRCMFRLRSRGFNRIVFQSFEEISTIVFMLLHPTVKIDLIVTNNLGLDRFERHPRFAKLIWRLITWRASTIFLHCRFEVQFLNKMIGDIDPSKLVVVPFHKMLARGSVRGLDERKPTVFFMGPEMAHKTMDPVIDLIKADTRKQYRYVFCGLREITECNRTFLESQDNVEIVSGYLSDDEFYDRISRSMFVIITHNRAFEGRLSGLFCDAIACGTPIIARAIEPHVEFAERFGDLGYLVDFDDNNWAVRFLAADVESDFTKFQRSMELVRQSCGIEQIRSVFETALTRNLEQ